MPAPSYTYTLTNGTTADASQVQQNFTDILNGVTDGTKDLSINALTLAGALTANGNVTLGNASGDTLTVTGSLASSVVPSSSGLYDLGSSNIGMAGVYLAASGDSDTARVVAASHTADRTYTVPDLGTNGTFAFLEGIQTFTGIKNNTAMPAFFVHRNGSADANNNSANTEEAMSWTTETLDRGHFASNTFTVPTDGGGIYVFYAAILYQTNAVAGGEYYVRIKNGSTVLGTGVARCASGGTSTYPTVFVVANCAAGDTITCVSVTNQNHSGTAVTIDGGAQFTYFCGAKIC